MQKKEIRKATTPEDVKVLFVCPQPEEEPQDGVMKYVTCESIYDFKDIPDRSVVMCHPATFNIVECVADNAKLFGIKMIALSGVPNAEYAPEFDRVTWSLDRAAYFTLINDIKAFSEVEKQLAASDLSAHDRERAQAMRKTGEIAEMKDFVVAGQEPDSEDDTDDERIIT
jgi:hypothetical protein